VKCDDRSQRRKSQKSHNLRVVKPLCDKRRIVKKSELPKGILGRKKIVVRASFERKERKEEKERTTSIRTIDVLVKCALAALEL
jgi:hypothetical protein